MTGIRVRLLEDHDDRSGFDSGNIDLDRFFRKYAGQNQFKHHVGVTYVATEGSSILGFVTVAPGSIEIEHLPAKARRKLPTYPLPVLRIARMASSRAARGIGIGELLLEFSLQLAREMSARFGCVGVVVDAKEEAVSFYEGCGFEPFDVLEGGSEARPMPQPLFLPLGSIPLREGGTDP